MKKYYFAAQIHEDQPKNLHHYINESILVDTEA